jgi:hypothetical protein
MSGGVRGGIVWRVIPLAASSGLAFVGVVVIAAVLLVWWLLRAETRDDEAAKTEQEAAQQAEHEAAREADEDRLNAP